MLTLNCRARTMKKYGVYTIIFIGFMLLLSIRSAKSQTNLGELFVNKLSGKCIDVKGSPGTANGAILQLWTCESSRKGPNNSATDQTWIVRRDGFIQNVQSGKCIDVDGAPGNANGAILQLWTCESSRKGPNNSATDQTWIVRRDGFIQNVQSGKCIDVDGAPGNANGAILQLWTCEFSGKGPNNSATDQIWTRSIQIGR